MTCLFGDIMKIETTGASEMTAREHNLDLSGVEASRILAENDLAQMEKYKNVIIKVGRKKKIDPAVIAGMISRESRAGASLKDGWDDKGNCFGLMQVDKHYHTPVGEWDSDKHITQAIGILIDCFQATKAKFSKWSLEQHVKGGISAYNAGVKNLQSYERMDFGTTGDDYGNDVVARAQWFKGKGY